MKLKLNLFSIESTASHLDVSNQGHFSNGKAAPSSSSLAYEVLIYSAS
jgi:hypothetical protein